MNIKMVLNTVGRMLLTLAVLLLLPSAVSLYYGETKALLSFLITAGGSAVLGLVLNLVFRPKSHTIYAKEGFTITAFCWLAVSLVGAVPFVLSGNIPSYVDAFFETVSGFTTTGASILTDVESCGRGILFWRSFTHWVGGMGVLVFVVAIIPNISDRSIHMLRAEMPGPVMGKLVPKLKDTAKILYIMYLCMTALEIIALKIGGMSLYESFVLSFGTAGTGGFAVKADGLGSYSAYSQWVIGVFMMLFGINFNLYYFILLRRFKDVIKNSEVIAYLSTIFVATVVITLNINPLFGNIGESIRHAFFQVSTIITTTGYSTTDFNLWPDLSKAIMLVLMFTGACAGSTAGGLKFSRVVMLFKLFKRELKKMLHPKSVSTVRMDSRPVDETVLNSAGVYFGAYMICFFIIFLLISFEPFGLETNFSAVASCFNNIGPGFAAVGPMGSFASYTDFSKIILSVAMLLGRLEIFPLLIALSPATWRKR